MLLKCVNGLSHLRQVRPPVVDRFYLCLDRRSMIDESLGDFRGRADLAVNTPVRPPKVMKRPIRDTFFQILFEFAPAGNRAR
jgi:hypothetical protein